MDEDYFCLASIHLPMLIRGFLRAGLLQYFTPFAPETPRSLENHMSTGE